MDMQYFCPTISAFYSQISMVKNAICQANSLRMDGHERTVKRREAVRQAASRPIKLPAVWFYITRLCCAPQFCGLDGFTITIGVVRTALCVGTYSFVGPNAVSMATAPFFGTDTCT